MSNGGGILFRPGAGVLGVPAAEIDDVVSGALTPDAAILGIPFDGGVASLPGQRHGPELLRHYAAAQPWSVDEAGALGGVYDPVTRRRVLDGRVVFDLGDLGAVPIDPRVTRTAYYKALADVSGRLAKNCRTAVFIGGDHSISAPIAVGLAGVHGAAEFICFDAHCDFSSRPMPRLSDITHADFLGYPLAEGAISSASIYGVRTFLPVSAGPVPEKIRCAYEYSEVSLGEDSHHPVYLSIDLDVIDPGELTGTGHPEAGGYRLTELLRAVDSICRSRRVVALDIVEATYDERANRVTGAAIATILMTFLRALLERTDNPAEVPG